MLTIRITVDKSGLDKLRQLGKGKVKQTLSGIVQVGGTLLFHNTLRRYDAAVDPDGAAWSTLRPSTLKRKGGRGRLLVESVSAAPRFAQNRRQTHHTTDHPMDAENFLTSPSGGAV